MKYTPIGELVAECAPGLWFPKYLRVEGPAPGVEPAGQFTVRAMLVCDLPALEYKIHQVELSSEIDGRFTGEIDTQTYRSLRLLELKSGVGEAAGRSTGELPADAYKYGLMTRRVSDEEEHSRLTSVAERYVKGAFSGRRPQRDVSDGLQMPIATAGRWVRRAKDLGYLPDGVEALPDVQPWGSATDVNAWIEQQRHRGA